MMTINTRDVSPGFAKLTNKETITNLEITKLSAGLFEKERHNPGSINLEEIKQYFHKAKELIYQKETAQPELVENVRLDKHVTTLGYECIGLIDKFYPTLPKDVLEDWYRVWIWENKKGRRVATWDDGNTWLSYLCEGTKEAILSVHKNMVGA